MTIDLFPTWPFRAAASLPVQQRIFRGWPVAIAAAYLCSIGWLPPSARVFTPLKSVPSMKPSRTAK